MATLSENLTDAAVEATCDAFLDGRFRAFQPRQGPRASIDTLLLAAAIPTSDRAEANIVEAGAGVGIASLALATRAERTRLTGVEIQPGLVALARRNTTLNGLDGRVRLVEGDLAQTAAELGIAAESFDHGMANPPFLDRNAARLPPSPMKARSYAADKGALSIWVRFLARTVRPRGSVTFIHRAEALDQLLEALKHNFGGVTVFPLFPREGCPAGRVIVQARKGSRAPLVLAPGLILHEADGRYTPAADAVLRDGRALAIEK